MIISTFHTTLQNPMFTFSNQSNKTKIQMVSTLFQHDLIKTSALINYTICMHNYSLTCKLQLLVL